MGEWVPVFLSETKEISASQLGSSPSPQGEAYRTLLSLQGMCCPLEEGPSRKHTNTCSRECILFSKKKKKIYGTPGEISVRLSEGLYLKQSSQVCLGLMNNTVTLLLFQPPGLEVVLPEERRDQRGIHFEWGEAIQPCGSSTPDLVSSS